MRKLAKPIVIALILILINLINTGWGQCQYIEEKNNSQLINKWLREGKCLSQAEDYQRAMAVFDKLIEINPDSLIAWVEKGFALNGLERYKEAITCFDKALTINESSSLALAGKGVALSKLGNEEAVSYVEKATQVTCKDADDYVGCGIAYFNLGNLSQAIINFTEAININPRHAEAYLYRGFAHNKQASLSFAVYDYDKAIEINPTFVTAYLYRGNARCEESVLFRSFNNDIKDNPDLEVFYALAFNDYNKAISINPKNANSYFMRGRAYFFSKGSREFARQDWEKAIELNPEGSIGKAAQYCIQDFINGEKKN